jgi:hypothetical protein
LATPGPGRRSESEGVVLVGRAAMRSGEIKSERMIVRKVNILSLIRGVDDKMLSVKFDRD